MKAFFLIERSLVLLFLNNQIIHFSCLTLSPFSNAFVVGILKMVVAIPLVPHGPANMQSTFITTHDKEYTGPECSGTWSSLTDKESGHTSNRVLFGRTNHLSSDTTYAGHFRTPKKRLADSQWATVLHESVKPQELATAFAREKSTVGVLRDEKPTISTMKSSFTNSGPVSTCRPAHYSGDGTVQFNRTLLYIPDSSNGVPRRSQSASNSTFQPRDSEVPTAGRRSLLHSAMLPNTYFLHSRLIGDTSLAKRGQLPTPLSSASEFQSALERGDDPRKFLSTVAGARLRPTPSQPSRFETNPITMTPKEQADCRVSRRVELQGHVSGTTYHAHFVNQKNLPELADPVSDKGSDRTVKLPEVPPRPHQSVQLAQANGSLLPERPAGVHPSVWKRLKAVEKELSVDKNGDPHAHKSRAPLLR